MARALLRFAVLGLSFRGLFVGPCARENLERVGCGSRVAMFYWSGPMRGLLEEMRFTIQTRDVTRVATASGVRGRTGR